MIILINTFNNIPFDFGEYMSYFLNVNKLSIIGHVEGQIVADEIILGKNSVIRGDVLFKSFIAEAILLDAIADPPGEFISNKIALMFVFSSAFFIASIVSEAIVSFWPIKLPVCSETIVPLIGINATFPVDNEGLKKAGSNPERNQLITSSIAIVFKIKPQLFAFFCSILKRW